MRSGWTCTSTTERPCAEKILLLGSGGLLYRISQHVFQVKSVFWVSADNWTTENWQGRSLSKRSLVVVQKQVTLHSCRSAEIIEVKGGSQGSKSHSCIRNLLWIFKIWKKLDSLFSYCCVLHCTLSLKCVNEALLCVVKWNKQVLLSSLLTTMCNLPPFVATFLIQVYGLIQSCFGNCCPY